MEWEDKVHRGVPGQTSRTAAIFPAGSSERVWGVAYEIGREYWDRVLEAKVGMSSLARSWKAGKPWKAREAKKPWKARISRKATILE